MTDSVNYVTMVLTESVRGVMSTETFASISKEKQDIILDAALLTFGRNGYKKASVNDIASAAGISKASVFYYFGSKKALYLYLVKLCFDTLISEIEKRDVASSMDFFERIKLATEVKIGVISEHQPMMSFLTSVYYETDPDIVPGIKEALSGRKEITDKIAFSGVDTSDFKDGVDPKLVYKILIWMAEGYGSVLSRGDVVDVDGMVKEFYQCLDLMKENFYK